MGYSYPVLYFDCGKTTGLAANTFHDQLKKTIRMDSVAGDIVGDTGIEGLKLDFNSGLRLAVPRGNFRVRITERLTGLVFFDNAVTETVLISLEKYFIRWQVEIWQDGAPVFSHAFDPAGKLVRFVCFPRHTLGDFVYFMPYLPYFAEHYHSKVYATIYDGVLRPLAERYMPEIPLAAEPLPDTYASYYFSANNNAFTTMPLETPGVPLAHIPMVSLGLRRPPRLRPWPTRARVIAEPYVCIGVQASSATKGWHYPGGWQRVVDYIKSLGYRVLCIDAMSHYETHGYVSDLPPGAEDCTGYIPLEERADMLFHAAFFVGLSSGLAWLANLVGCPVVLISGFTAYWHEFPEAYRVYNPFVCNGCANDQRLDYYGDFFCPRHAGVPEHELECSRLIAPEQVMAAIDELRRDKFNVEVEHAGE